MQSFYGRILYIQIDFEYPLYISQTINQDSLQVEFLNQAELFVSETSNQTLREDSLILSTKIKAQDSGSKTERVLTKSTEETAGFMSKGFWIILILTTVASQRSVGLSYA